MPEGSPSLILYLDKDDYRALHAYLAERSLQDGEPIPPFEHAGEGDLDALIKTPQASYFGQEVYPTLEEKAAIILYTINKKQIFLNGNKRMSTLSLLVFLGINGKMLGVTPDALTAKALWLANTTSLEFPAIKEDLVRWIRDHVKDVPFPAVPL